MNESIDEECKFYKCSFNHINKEFTFSSSNINK